MKNIITLFALLIVLCSFKGDIPVNPEFFGTWRCVKTIKDKPGKVMVYDWTFKQNSKSNKIDIYKKSDPDGKPSYVVKMQDPTHFKGTGYEDVDANVSVDHELTGYFDDNKFIISDHYVKSIISQGVRSKRAGDWKYEFRKFDPTTKFFIAFPKLKATEAFDGN